MIRNLRDNHSEPWVQTSDSIEHETDKGNERTVEIQPQPNNGGARKASEPTVSALQLSRQSLQASKQDTSTVMRC